MRRIYWMVGIAIFFLASCGNNKQADNQFVRPVKVATVESRSEISKDFSGIVEAVNFVKLAFRVSGQIINLPVVEGQRVEEGQLIAEIDTRDLALQYAADKAAYETAEAQLERNKRLLDKQAISVQEFEISRANYQKARSAFDLSGNNMKDARLKAPFAGSIEKKLAENYQRVSSGVPIVQLINTKNLQIRFTVPDNNLELLKAGSKDFKVEFETSKGHYFKARLKEYLDASPDGSGIPVTVTIDDPEFDRARFDVKPGFACNVNMRVSIAEYLDKDMTWVPLTAIFSDDKTGKECVWVVDESNKVSKREVTIYTPTGESFVLVSKGIEPGEKVVTAGVYRLTEGEAVKMIQ